MLRLILPALVLLLLMPSLIAWRGYPWQLALLTSMAISGLVYAGARTAENLRSVLAEGRKPLVLRSRGAEVAPGPETQGGEEKEMGPGTEGEPTQQKE